MSKEQLREPCFATGHGIICAGLPRSGTASLAAALTILDFGPVHHGLRVTDIREHYGWGQAAWCNMQYLRKTRLHMPMDRLPFYMNHGDPLLPWTRTDWDRLIGRTRVITDLGSLFGEQLITEYPEAKVILVERPVDTWMTSFGTVLVDGVCCGFPGFALCDLGPWVGSPRSYIIRDMIMGWLKADSRRMAWQRMPIAHSEHSAMVRKLVPSDQLLQYRLEDGWEPLCRFLGVPVPDMPFPHVNDKSEGLQFRNMVITVILTRIVIKLGCWTLAFAAAGLALKYRAGSWLIDMLSAFGLF
jgi:hypothetical protein